MFLESYCLPLGVAFYTTLYLFGSYFQSGFFFFISSQLILLIALWEKDFGERYGISIVWHNVTI